MIPNDFLELLSNSAPLGYEADECLLLVVPEASNLEFRVGEDWLIVRRYTYNNLWLFHFNKITIKDKNQSKCAPSDAPSFAACSPVRLGFSAPCLCPVCSSGLTVCKTAKCLDGLKQPTSTAAHAWKMVYEWIPVCSSEFAVGSPKD